MQSAKSRQEYTDEIKVIEANIKDIASGEAPQALFEHSQSKLDKLAERFQYDEHLGTARYKLYELQALLYYYQNKDSDALSFIQQAVEIKGASYERAERLIEQLQSVPAEHGSHGSNHELPLELQSLIKSMRTSAIIMAVLSVLSVYFIPWAVFYIVLATKLKPEELPNRKLVKWAAIATLPLCIALIPLLIDVEFWRMNRRLKEYDEQGAEAFKSDKEFLASEPKRKKKNKIAWTILLSIIVIFVILIIVALAWDNPNTGSSNTPGSFLNSETPTPYTSAEHGFVVNFPGFPSTEHSSLDVQGVSVPYTYYSKDVDNGNKSYAVQVIEYPTSDFDLSGQERGSLDGGINGTAQTDGFTLVTSSNNGTFLGYPSASATYRYSSGGDSYDVYSHNFIKGNNMYVLMTIGESKATFDTFVNSFRFQ